MVSELHEGLVSLFRERPALAPELLVQALSAEVPEYTEARVDSADLTVIRPTEYRADIVVQLRNDDSVFGIVVEVQLNKDDDKGFVWPVYIATLRDRIRCPVCLLVVTPDANVAHWACQPIALGGDSRVVPLVLHPENIPEILRAEQAREHPELAVLSAIVHGRDADAEKSAEIALAAHSAAALLDTRRSEMYFDLVLYCLSEAARRVLQAMDTTKYQYQSEFARRYFGQGREEGKAEGNVEGRAEMALKLLSLRFGRLPEVIRGRVLRARASDLDALAERLLSAHTLDEALEDLG
jgi:hypothetical protein